MIALGFNEFVRNIKRNILIVVQMMAVYIIAIFTISAFEEQYRLMDGVDEIFDDTGMILSPTDMSGNVYIERDVLEEILVKVEHIDFAIRTNVIDENHPASSINIVSSNPKNISYRPELLEGVWCEDAVHEEGVINVVASNNMPFDIKVGEKIEFGGAVYKVTGIVATNEMIYGIKSSLKYTEASYLDYYAPIDSLAHSGANYWFIASYYDLIKYDVRPFETSLSWGMFTTVDFEDDISENDIQYNIKQISDHFGYKQGGEMFLTGDMYTYSWNLIMAKIMPMLMLLIVIIIVLIVSLIISGAINILYEKKNYGIYFICGNNWKNTFKLSIVNWTIMAVTSLTLAGCACVYIYSAKIFDGLILTFTSMHLYALGAITLVMLVITTIIPFIMLRKIQPVSILKENNN